jgi:hypothetical protein
MKWNREEVSRLLKAVVTDEPLLNGEIDIVVRFEDARMRYEMYVREEGVFLAADPDQPVQGLPYFEFVLPCTELRPVPRTGMPTGIGMFAGPTLLFSITRRDDGNISLSGWWDGMIAALSAAT